MSAPEPADGGRDNGELHDAGLDLGLDDEELDQILEEFEAADRHAADVLIEALGERRGAPVPETELSAAGERLREGLHSGQHPFDWIRRGAELGEELPADDAELLLACAAGTISPREETGLDIEEESSIIALERADWLGAIVSAVRAGPGANASADALIAGIDACPEVDFEGIPDPDEDAVAGLAFELVSLPWSCMGLIDEDERLTALGAWALPRALARAWGAEFDPEPSG